MRSYADAVEGLYALGAELHSTGTKPRRKFDLEHMRTLTRALGSPERRFPSVLIAGTNGKGSTSASLASILTTSGYRTALYTSPHLIRPNERIRIDGEAIADDDFAETYGRVQDCVAQLMDAGELPQAASFFETMTAMAFLNFAERDVDIAVLEVGLGGRLDATNVVEPLISVITDIDLDHQQWLGNTLPEIAREKAGIMRAQGTVVMLPQHPAVTQALGEVAALLGARAVNAAEYLPDMTGKGHEDEYDLSIFGLKVRVESPLHGRHQWRNLALALATAAELKTNFGFEKITAESVERGVRETRWPGRLQSIDKDGQRYLLDVAHNPAGAWALRAALADVAQPITLVFGAMVDKDVRDIATVLFPVAERVVLTRAQTPRAAEPAQLAAAAAHTGSEFMFSGSVAEGLRMAAEVGRRGTSAPKRPALSGRDTGDLNAGVYPKPLGTEARGGARPRSAEDKAAQAGGTIVVTGSVFVVGEALALLDPESVR